ncbi:MAG: CRISPR-associated protein Cas4 [Bilifractor sp.]|jgi:CRISPR-associated exonuclease Cas4
MINDLSISIRNLQHFMYCPHRWGLINIECSWAENYFVTKADLMHQRVHNPDHSYVSAKKRVLTAVPVYHDELGLFGVTDCIELRKDRHGVPIKGYPDTYDLTIVEYKPRQPSGTDYKAEDVIQVFAQKVCVDFIFKCDCRGVIYYGDTRARKELPLRENYRQYYSELLELIAKIRENTVNGTIPPIKTGQKCGGCSFRDLCLPQLSKTRKKLTFHDLLIESNKPEGEE